MRKKNAQLKVVPPDMTTGELMFVELAVVKSSEYLKRKKDVTEFIHATLEGIDKYYKQSQSIRYEDVLSLGKHKSGKRIVISGAPGCGKTTLSRKYCKDLSSGVLPNDYQLVILCHLREVSHHLKENEELALNHFLAKYSRHFDVPSIAATLQKSKGKGLLLILDGYDEISEQMKKSKVMKDLLSPDSHYLDECDLIVTTRPFTCREVLSGMVHHCLHVEILGFTEEKINLFIDNYFRVPNKKMSDQMKERLQSLPSVQGMCCLPVVLKIICKVQEYLEDGGLPRTMGGIYRLYIKRQLLLNAYDLKIADILKIPDHLLPGFSPLCQVAYRFSKTQKLVLSVEDLGEDLVKYVKRGSIYELLFAESADDFDAASPVQLYMFLHKTIQEALAAVHVTKQTKPDQEKIWREQLGRPEMAGVWKFYCNFTKLENIDFLSLLQASDDQSGNRNVLLMLSFFEADNEDLSNHYLPQVIPSELLFHINSVYETVVLQYTLQHHDNIRILKITTSSKRVKAHLRLLHSTIWFLRNLKEFRINGVLVPHTKLLDSQAFSDLLQDDTKVTKLLDSQEFSDLLQEKGAITLQITKCTTIGPPRKGKTHLKYLLTDQLWDNVGSTVAMVAPEWVEVYSSSKDSKDSMWKLYDRTERESDVLQDMKSDIYKPKEQDEEVLIDDSKIEKSPSPKLEQDQSPTTSSEVVQAGSLQETETSIPNPQLYKAKPEQEKETSLDKGNEESLQLTAEQSERKSPSSGLQLLNKAYSDDKEKEFRRKLQQVQQSETRSHEEQIIHFIDTGGQPIYHDVHPVLITSPSVYLLVFSLKDLRDNPSADFLSPDLLVKALRSIQTLGTKQPENNEYLKLHPKYPKIFIIGTHKDQIDSKECNDLLQMVHDKVKANLKNKPYSDYVCYDTNGCSFWSVDNTQAGKAVDQEYYNGLRRRVQSGSTTIEVTLPPSWYLLEHFTHQHKQKCLLYSDLKEFSAKHDLVKREHFREMVHLFHILGFYYYKIPHGYTQEDSIIFTDPNFLYKMTSKLLQKIENELKSNAESKISPKNAINVLEYLETMDDLMDTKIDPKWFVALLEELFLIADLFNSSWLVPAALPRGPEAVPSDSSLLFTLIAPITKSISFIPSGLFCSLMASLSQEWRPEEFYRNYAVFAVSQLCHVTIREHDSFIEVSYETIGQSSEEEYNQVKVRETIYHRLLEIQNVLYEDLGSNTDQRLSSAPRVSYGFLCRCRDSITGGSKPYSSEAQFHFAEYLQDDRNICAECTEPKSDYLQNITEEQLSWICKYTLHATIFSEFYFSFANYVVWLQVTERYIIE